MTDSHMLVQTEQNKIHSLQELEVYCEFLARKFSDKSILLLNGQVGAGKTKTVECILKSLGSIAVSSPTFAFHQVYKTNKYQVEHFDLYRIENEDDLESIGFWDVFMQDHGLVIVEWAEKIKILDIPEEWKLFVLDIYLEGETRAFNLSERKNNFKK